MRNKMGIFITRKTCSRRSILIIFCITCYIITHSQKVNDSVSTTSIKFKTTKSTATTFSGVQETCELPKLNPFDEDIITYSNKSVTKIICEGKDWVKCYFSECKVIPEILETTRLINCTYNDILYENDLHYHLGPDFTVINNDTYILNKSDHVKVSCKAIPSNNLPKSEWKGYGAGLRVSVERKPVPPHRESSYNLLIFGYESTTRNGFIRNMPKSYNYLTKVMKGIVLNGYNVLDDRNSPILLPLLTGKTLEELFDTKKIVKNKRTLDFLPFIFYHLKELGYRTAYFQDLSRSSAIQYRFNGFLRQPTDHYLRAFFLEERNGNWFERLKNGYCLGDTPQHKFMMNITDQFMHLDGKKFAFTFLSDITRDDFKMITNTDDDLVSLLESLTKAKIFENTLLIIMGDGNMKYGHFQNTFQGQLEERLPLMCIVLPAELKQKRPSVENILKANAEVLTTAHDIHATLLDVLDMTERMDHYKVPKSQLYRSLDLLDPVPETRTCHDAQISPKYCACYNWMSLSYEDSMAMKVIRELVNYINYLTDPVRDNCEFLALANIEWVRKHRYKNLEETRSGRGTYTTENYHVKVILIPGDSVFEAFIKYVVEDKRFIFDSTDITRINSNDEESLCLTKRLRNLKHLKPYCYCVDQDTTLINSTSKNTTSKLAS